MLYNCDAFDYIYYYSTSHIAGLMFTFTLMSFACERDAGNQFWAVQNVPLTLIPDKSEWGIIKVVNLYVFAIGFACFRQFQQTCSQICAVYTIANVIRKPKQHF